MTCWGNLVINILCICVIFLCHLQDIDIWKFPDHNGKASLLIPGDVYDVIKNEFDLIGLSYDVAVDDVSRYLVHLRFRTFL